MIDQYNQYRLPLLIQLEKEIAELLLKKLESFGITLERASQIARFTLSKLPGDLSDQQVLTVLPGLDDEYYELAGIVLKHLEEYERLYKPVILSQVQDLIRHHHFEEASRLMEQYLAKIVTQLT